MELNLNTVEGLSGFIQHILRQTLTTKRRAMVQEIIGKNLRPLTTELEQADERSDYAAMLRLPTQHHEVLGQWIETSALAY